MAAMQTPPRKLYGNQLQKRSLPDSPTTTTPSRIPKKKKNQNNEISEEKDISLRDIYEIINALKVDIQDKHDILEERMSSLEKRLTDKFSKLADDVKKQVQDEIKIEKEKMEEDINKYFQFLEDDLRSKMDVLERQQS